MGTCCLKEVIVYIDGGYTCASCGRDRTGEYLLQNGYDFTLDLSEFVKQKNSDCECGAEKTSNSNCHAVWCPKYPKP